MIIPAAPPAVSRQVDYISQVSYSFISHPTIGASGAVFGILAAFIYLYPNTYIYLYFLVPIKTKYIGLFYFGTEIYSGIVKSAGDNIAHWAHIGGGLVGFLLVLTWNKKIDVIFIKITNWI
ncbi:MAG: rhomboid family intramembrane serine protease [Segetibacter sp.]